MGRLTGLLIFVCAFLSAPLGHAYTPAPSSTTFAPTTFSHFLDVIVRHGQPSQEEIARRTQAFALILATLIEASPPNAGIDIESFVNRALADRRVMSGELIAGPVNSGMRFCAATFTTEYQLFVLTDLSQCLSAQADNCAGIKNISRAGCELAVEVACRNGFNTAVLQIACAYYACMNAVLSTPPPDCETRILPGFNDLPTPPAP